MATPSSRRHWELWGALGGLAAGAGDTALLWSLGVDISFAGRDATIGVGAVFTSTCVALGYAVGALLRARARVQENVRVIERQVRELAASQRKVAEHEKLAALGQLAAGIAHEVRNPLGVIRASASMLRERFEPGDEARRASEFILEEIDRLNGLITSLLGFARPAEPRLQATSSEKVIDRALQLASEELRRRDVAVDRQLACEGALPELLADPDLVCQALLDLLLNAAEAIGERGRLRIRARANGADELEIEVADSGAGVSAPDAVRVFEPFFTTKAKGTGLGLPMAARIARAHGGALELVQPRGGEAPFVGARFRLRLPLAGPPGAGEGAE